MAVATSLRRFARSSGLDTKSNAPSLSARTAVSMLPCAVITATGTLGGILLHPFDQIQAIAVRQLHVGQAQIEPLGLEQPLRRADRAGNARGEVHALQGDRQELANIRLVIDDQYGRFRHVGIVASATRLAALCLPALRIAEDHSENAAAADAGLIQQDGAVQLAQLAGDEESEPGAALAPGKKRLEDAIGGLRLYPRSRGRRLRGKGGSSDSSGSSGSRP